MQNYNVAVREWNDQIIFLRKIIPGGADKSYGIQVARLAGLPDEILARAKEILAHLEATAAARTAHDPPSRNLPRPAPAAPAAFPTTNPRTLGSWRCFERQSGTNIRVVRPRTWGKPLAFGSVWVGSFTGRFPEYALAPSGENRSANASRKESQEEPTDSRSVPSKMRLGPKGEDCHPPPNTKR